MNTESIFNFIKVSEKIATAGQPTQEQLQAAYDEGYSVIINLAPENAENHALPDERKAVTSIGMDYHNIPVEWNSPSVDDFDKFTKIMKGLGETKVLIHCAANFRVSAFYSLYAMKNQNWSVGQADQLIAKIWESRPDYRMDDTWKTFVNLIRSTSS